MEELWCPQGWGYGSRDQTRPRWALRHRQSRGKQFKGARSAEYPGDLQTLDPGRRRLSRGQGHRPSPLNRNSRPGGSLVWPTFCFPGHQRRLRKAGSEGTSGKTSKRVNPWPREAVDEEERRLDIHLYQRLEF